MIELDYELDSHFAPEMRDRDLSNATRTDLDFDLFSSDFFFRVDGQSLSAPRGWGIPIVGFADQIFESASAAARGLRPPDVEFPESQDRIRLQLIDDRVHIEPTYSEARATVSVSEFLAASDAFLRRVITEVSTHSPAILQSDAFEAIRRKVTINRPEP